VPLLNLLIPVIGTAAMVHVLDRAIAGMRPDAPNTLVRHSPVVHGPTGV
jgi:hypothetical protein